MSLAQYSKEELRELSLIEMAYEYLKNSKQPIALMDLVNEIAQAAGVSEEEMRARLAQFYTDINIDGRFLSLGENRWGLRVWYPVDTAEEEIVTSVKPKRKKGKKVIDDEIEDLDDYEDLEDEEYEDLDVFDDEDELLDEDEDFDEVDEVDEFDDDVIEDEEDFALDDELDETLDDEDDELDDEDEEEDL